MRTKGTCKACGAVLPGEQRKMDLSGEEVFVPDFHNCNPLPTTEPVLPKSADIKVIRPDTKLTNGAFIGVVAPQVPEGVAIVVMWLDAEGAVHLRTNYTQRRDWAYFASHLAAWSVQGPPV